MADRSVQRVKGTRDLLPPDTALWAAVEAEAREVFGQAGYQEIRTPILEHTELFVRSVGEDTDIVGKEMYSFTDRGGRGLTMRPENTAGVVRAFVENGLSRWPQPVKLFYVGPQFRNEKPQAHRYRQFNQIGAELFGDAGPLSDAELVLMLVRFLRRLGFRELTVLVNTVGDVASRLAYRDALQHFLAPHRDRLGADSRRRLDTNPLRILDTKIPAEQELLRNAPELAEHLSRECRSHFETVCSFLERFEVPYRVEPRLVRGLDYYTRTVFEIVAEGLGAQNAVVGGGRYDGLVAELGGPDVAALGFAIGEDRLLSLLPESFARDRAPEAPVLVAALTGVDPGEALAVAEELREAGRKAVAELTPRSPGAALKRADKGGSRYVVLVGEEELATGRVTWKDLTTREQHTVPRAELAARLSASDEERT